MKRNIRVLLIVSLVVVALALAFASAQAAGATLTVNFPGVTVGHVWVRQAGTNTDVVPPLGAHTDSVDIAVPNGTYDVWVQQGNGAYEKQFNVDCTGATCTATFSISDLTVNFPGVAVGNVLVRVPGTNSDVIPWSGAKTDSYGPVKLLADKYDIWVEQGNGKWEIISNVDCSAGGACTAAYSVANLTVNFNGVTVGNVWIRQSGGTNNDVVPPLGVKTNSAGPINLLADTYDVWIQQGSGVYEKKLGVDCSAAGACSANFAVKTLTVNFTGVTVSNVWVRTPGTNSDVVTPLGSQTDTATTKVLADSYDVWVQQGGGAYEKKLDVDCKDPSGPCEANYGVATLTVPFAGFSGVSVWVRVPDGAACAANGGTAISGSGLSNQGVFKVLQDNYDVITQVAGKYYTYDNVNCTGATCTAQPSLTVNFPGINGVHTYVKKSDGAAGTATGADVANQTYKNNQAVFAALAPNKYDVVVVQGAMKKVIDDVMAFGSCASVDNIVATLTVNFPGINGVHTYVKTDDGTANSFTGGDVANTTYKNDTTTLTVLKGVYDVKVVQGAQGNIYDAIDCTSGACTITDIVATLTVNFPGINGVHTYVKTDAGGAFTGGDVANTTYKNGTTSLTVLKGVYDVKVVQGAQQNIYNRDCSSGACTITDIVATLTVNFPGISGVHTYVKTNDGTANSLAGGDVANTTYKNETTSLTVLKGVYDVKVVQGAQGNIYDAVDCTNGTCTIEDIVATLTVNFPGISGVHTYVKTNDGTANSFTGGDVANTTYKNNATTIKLLKAVYDVKVVQGAQGNIYDPIDCTSGTCSINNIVSNFTLHFPGKTGVHVYVKLNDGAANSATGADVTNRTYQNNKTTMALLKGTYDLVVNIGGVNTIIDAVDCTSDPAVYSLAIVKLLNSSGSGIAGGQVQYYSGGWKNLGATSASGALGAAIPGAPASYPFSMNYAFARQEKSQNIGTDLIVVFQTKNVVVELRNSANTLMDPGKAQYYAGGWHDIGNTSGGKASIQLLPLTYPFSMDYAYARQEKSQNVGSDATVVFKTTSVEVQLQDHTGALGALPGEGKAQYYAGGWHDIANTTGGKKSIELLPLTYPFSMDYAFARQEKSQNVGSDATVVFRTTSVEVQLQDHTGALGALPGEGKAQYYAGGWHDIANMTGGKVSIELLPLTYPFSMDYAFARQEKSQNVGTTPTVTFQTTNVTVELRNSVNSLIDTGAVQYYAGGWHDISTTSGGQVSIELLPLTYPFSMDYAFARQEKSQNVGTNATVIFQTGKVTSDSDTCTNYYAGGWRAFTQDMELLPGSYPFQFSGGFPQTTYPISGATVNHIH